MSLRLREITVRRDPVGGRLTDRVEPADVRSFHGGHHLLILIHGYNNDEPYARQSYHDFLDGFKMSRRLGMPDIVAMFFWPGDLNWGRMLSRLSYPRQIETARQAAQRLADWLHRIAPFGAGGLPVTFSFIGHSLGCRLLMETMRESASRPGARLHIPLLTLMAAAVPTDLLVGGGSLSSSADVSRQMLAVHSKADAVLHRAFPLGQTAAWMMRIERGCWTKAVGRFGVPKPHGKNVMNVQASLGHSRYWDHTDPQVGRKVARALDATSPRELPAYHGPAAALLPERTIGSRDFPARGR